ncbi:MAG: GEVED domain-containing protein [Planctomycetota bacterium]
MPIASFIRGEKLRKLRQSRSRRQLRRFVGIDRLEDRRLLAANVAPEFTATDIPSVLEESGPALISNFATFDPGSADESDQNVAEYLVDAVSNTELFDGLPTVDTSGNLRYTPAPDAFGTATFELRVRDDGGTEDGGVDLSAAQTFTIEVIPVNDAPTFDLLTDLSANEDGFLSITNVASNFSPGPSGEDGRGTAVQMLHQEGTSGTDDPLSQDKNSPTNLGTLAIGSNLVQGFVNQSQNTGDVDVFTFTVPEGTLLDELTVEDYAYPVPPGGNEANAFLAINDAATFPYTVNELSFSNPAFDPSDFLGGSVFGLADIVSSGGTNFLPRVGTVTGRGFTGPLGPGVYTVHVQQTGPANTYTLNFGVRDAGGQVLDRYDLEIVSGGELFESTPSVDNSGTLSGSLVDDAFGQAIVRVSAMDTGDTSNGGDNSSVPLTATITVNPVNDRPSFEAENPPSVSENSSFQSLDFATFDPGASNESGQSVLQYEVLTVTNPSLFAVQPSIDSNGRLSYQPMPGQTGTSLFTVRVQDDGGTDNGGRDTSNPSTFTIEVTEALALDFGDAGSSYEAADPARHLVDSQDVLLGINNTIDDGPIEPNAIDEGDDGVNFWAPLLIDTLGGSSTLTSVIIQAPNGGQLDAWIDFDGNGVFSDGERIANSQTMTSGANLLRFNVPSSATSGSSWARFRISPTGGLSPNGVLADGSIPTGEVEDYQVTLSEIDGPEGLVVRSDVETTLTQRGSTLSLGNPLDSSDTDPAFQIDASELQAIDVQTNGVSLIVDLDGNLDFLPDTTVGASGSGIVVRSPQTMIDLVDEYPITLVGTFDLTFETPNLESVVFGPNLISSEALRISGLQASQIDFTQPDAWRVSPPEQINGAIFTRLSLVDTSQGGGSLLINNDTPWHNIVWPLNVNANGDVSSLDALLVINELTGVTRHDPETRDLFDLAENPGLFGGAYYDVNADGKVSPLDALLIINHLISQFAADGEMIDEPASSPWTSSAIDEVWSSRNDNEEDWLGELF